jgi:hypothetical protein
MIYKIQVVTVSEDGCQETLEIACVERTDFNRFEAGDAWLDLGRG